MFNLQQVSLLSHFSVTLGHFCCQSLSIVSTSNSLTLRFIEKLVEKNQKYFSRLSRDHGLFQGPKCVFGIKQKFYFKKVTFRNHRQSTFNRSEILRIIVLNYNADSSYVNGWSHMPLSLSVLTASF